MHLQNKKLVLYLTMCFVLLSLLATGAEIKICEDGEETVTACDGVYCIAPVCPDGSPSECVNNCGDNEYVACENRQCVCKTLAPGEEPPEPDENIPDFGADCNLPAIDSSNLLAYYQTYSAQMCSTALQFRRFIGTAPSDPETKQTYSFYIEEDHVSGKVLSSMEDAVARAISKTVDSQQSAITELKNFIQHYHNTQRLAAWTQKGCGGGCNFCQANSLADPCANRDEYFCNSLESNDFCALNYNCYWDDAEETCHVKCYDTQKDACGSFDCSGYLKPLTGMLVDDVIPEDTPPGDICGYGENGRFCTYDFIADECINVCEWRKPSYECSRKLRSDTHPKGFPQMISYCGFYDDANAEVTMRVKYTWDNSTKFFKMNSTAKLDEYLSEAVEQYPTTSCKKGLQVENEKAFKVDHPHVCSDNTKLDDVNTMNFEGAEKMVLAANTKSEREKEAEELHCRHFRFKEGVSELDLTLDYKNSRGEWSQGTIAEMETETLQLGSGSVTTTVQLPKGATVDYASFMLESGLNVGTDQVNGLKLDIGRDGSYEIDRDFFGADEFSDGIAQAITSVASTCACAGCSLSGDTCTVEFAWSAGTGAPLKIYDIEINWRKSASHSGGDANALGVAIFCTDPDPTVCGDLIKEKDFGIAIKNGGWDLSSINDKVGLIPITPSLKDDKAQSSKDRRVVISPRNLFGVRDDHVCDGNIIEGFCESFTTEASCYQHSPCLWTIGGCHRDKRVNGCRDIAPEECETVSGCAKVPVEYAYSSKYTGDSIAMMSVQICSYARALSAVFVDEEEVHYSGYDGVTGASVSVPEGGGYTTTTETVRYEEVQSSNELTIKDIHIGINYYQDFIAKNGKDVELGFNITQYIDEGTDACTEGPNNKRKVQTAGYLDSAFENNVDHFMSFSDKDGIGHRITDQYIHFKFANVQSDIENATFRITPISEFDPVENLAEAKPANRRVDVDARVVKFWEKFTDFVKKVVSNGCCGTKTIMVPVTKYRLTSREDPLADDITQLTDNKTFEEVGNGWRPIVGTEEDLGRWIMIDLGEVQTIGMFKLYAMRWENIKWAFDEIGSVVDDLSETQENVTIDWYRPGTFEIYTSKDAEVFTQVGDEFIWRRSEDDDFSKNFSAMIEPVDARYFAIKITSDIMNERFVPTTTDVMTEEGNMVIAGSQVKANEASSGLSEIELYGIKPTNENLVANIGNKTLEKLSPTEWKVTQGQYEMLAAGSPVTMTCTNGTQLVDFVDLVGVNSEQDEWTCPDGTGIVLDAKLFKPTDNKKRFRDFTYTFPLELEDTFKYNFLFGYYKSNDQCGFDVPGCLIHSDDGESSLREDTLIINTDLISVDTVDKSVKYGLTEKFNLGDVERFDAIENDEGKLEFFVSDTEVYPGEVIQVYVRYTPKNNIETNKLILSTEMIDNNGSHMYSGRKDWVHFKMDREEIKQRIEISACGWANLVSVTLTSYLDESEEDEIAAIEDLFGDNAVQTKEKRAITGGTPYRGIMLYRVSRQGQDGRVRVPPFGYNITINVLDSFINTGGKSLLDEVVSIPINVRKKELKDKDEKTCQPACLGDQLTSMDFCKQISMTCWHYTRDFFSMLEIMKAYYVNVMKDLDKVKQYSRETDAILDYTGQGQYKYALDQKLLLDLGKEVPIFEKYWGDRVRTVDNVQLWLSDIMIGFMLGNQQAQSGVNMLEETLEYWDKAIQDRNNEVTEEHLKYMCTLDKMGADSGTCLGFAGLKKMSKGAEAAFMTKYLPYNNPDKENFAMTLFWKDISDGLKKNFDEPEKNKKDIFKKDFCFDKDCTKQVESYALEDAVDVVADGTKVTLSSKHRNLHGETIVFMPNFDPNNLPETPQTLTLSLIVSTPERTLDNVESATLTFPTKEDGGDRIILSNYGLTVRYSQSTILIAWEQNNCENCEVRVTFDRGDIWPPLWYAFDWTRLSATVKGYDELVREERSREYSKGTTVALFDDKPMSIENLESVSSMISNFFKNICLAADKNAKKIEETGETDDLYDLEKIMTDQLSALPKDELVKLKHVVESWSQEHTIDKLMTFADDVIDMHDVNRVRSGIQFSEYLLNYMCVPTVKEPEESDPIEYLTADTFPDHWDCSIIKAAECGTGATESYCYLKNDYCLDVDVFDTEGVKFSDKSGLTPENIKSWITGKDALTILSPSCQPSVLSLTAADKNACSDEGIFEYEMLRRGCTRTRVAKCINTDAALLKSYNMQYCSVTDTNYDCTLSDTKDATTNVWYVDCESAEPREKFNESDESICEYEWTVVGGQEGTIFGGAAELQHSVSVNYVVSIQLKDVAACDRQRFSFSVIKEDDSCDWCCMIPAEFPFYFELGKASDNHEKLVMTVPISVGAMPGTCKLQFAMRDGVKTVQSREFDVVKEPISDPNECLKNEHKQNGVCCPLDEICCKTDDHCGDANTCIQLQVTDSYFKTYHCDVERNTCVENDIKDWDHCSALDMVCNKAKGGCTELTDINVVELSLLTQLGDVYRLGEQHELELDVIDGDMKHISGADISVTIGGEKVDCTEGDALYTCLIAFTKIGEQEVVIEASKGGLTDKYTKHVTVYDLLDFDWGLSSLAFFPGDTVSFSLTVRDSKGDDISSYNTFLYIDGKPIPLSGNQFIVPASLDFSKRNSEVRLCIENANYKPAGVCKDGEFCCKKKAVFIEESPFDFVDNEDASRYDDNGGNDGVDNDGDGKIDEDPIDGIDNDGDGLIDEDGHGGDGIDNDGDGRVDEDPRDGIDNDGDGLIDEDGAGVDLHIYNSNDGVDNDGDGKIDEDPIDGRDNDGDGLIDEDGYGGDRIDNDGDGLVDEDPRNGIDDDGDGLIDEDGAGSDIGLSYYRDGIDNDGDGKIDEDPIDGIDNDGDGLIDEDGRAGDGVDSDGDGLIDEDPIDGIDNDGDGLIDEDGYGGDGIDNDGDGRVDEDPRDGIDNDGDGLIDEDGAGVDMPLKFLKKKRAYFVGESITVPISSSRQGTVSCKSYINEEEKETKSCDIGPAGSCSVNFVPDTDGIMDIKCNAFGVTKSLRYNICDRNSVRHCYNMPAQATESEVPFEVLLDPAALTIIQGESAPVSVIVKNIASEGTSFEIKIAMPDDMHELLFEWSDKSASILLNGQSALENKVTAVTEVMYGQYTATILVKAGGNMDAYELPLEILYDIGTLESGIEQFDEDVVIVENNIKELRTMGIDPSSATFSLKVAKTEGVKAKVELKNKRYILSEKSLDKAEHNLSKAKQEAEYAKKLIGLKTGGKPFNALVFLTVGVLLVGTLLLVFTKVTKKK